MNYAAIEFDNGLNNTHMLGYLIIPEDFKAALSSTYYYPECASTNAIRVQYSKLDPRSPDYTSKDQKL